MKCSRSDSEQTSGTLEIFSRAILRTLLQICENSVFSDYELLGDRQISFCHFTLFNLLNYEIHCLVIGCFGEGGFSPKKILEILVVFTTILIIFRR